MKTTNLVLAMVCFGLSALGIGPPKVDMFKAGFAFFAASLL